MPDVRNYIRMSIDINLFFLRIMKEHSFFLQAGFVPKDAALSSEAGAHARTFEKLLREAVHLANGFASCEAIESGEFVTQFTLEAERATQEFTGAPFDLNTTKKEMGLSCHCNIRNEQQLAHAVTDLNRRALAATKNLICFKKKVLHLVTSCKIFTFNYPLLIDHILREALLFCNMLERLLCGKNPLDPRSQFNLEAFWSRIMAEHAKFIMGLLDPTEEALVEKARLFGKRFDVLTAEACERTRGVNRELLDATCEIRDFKAAGTDGILDCRIKSIIIPLLGDHTLREANHFIRLLKHGGNRIS